MEKMISCLCGISLMVAVMVMPLCGMQVKVEKKAVNNVELLNQIVDQAHKTVDAALSIFNSVDQKQQKSAAFEEEKIELIRLMEKIDLATIDLNKIDLNVKVKLAQLIQKVDFRTKVRLAQLMEKVDFKTKMKLDQLMKKIDALDGESKKAIRDAVKAIKIKEMEAAAKIVAVEISLLDQIVEQATHIIHGPFELRLEAKKELDRLMNDENLDIPTKVAISNDIEIIKNAVGMNIVPNVSDAYKHLQSVVIDIKAELDVASQGRMQQVIDYVSRNFQKARQTVSAMWYGTSNKK